MCGECIVERAQDFLIISGAVAMILVIIWLVILIGIFRRLNKTAGRIDRISKQAETIAYLPIRLLERRLEIKIGKDD